MRCRHCLVLSGNDRLWPVIPVPIGVHPIAPLFWGTASANRAGLVAHVVAVVFVIGSYVAAE